MSKIRNDIVENNESMDEDYSGLSQDRRRALAQFQDKKIGIIFHWGLYSQAGIVESWQLSKEDQWARKHPWRDNLDELRRDYWKLSENFDPSRFNPDDWATAVKKAGFKYALFTTKHHDGFAMYDTKQSDFSVAHFTGKDLFGEFVESFHRQDINVGAYYSKPDWHSPYYWEPNSNPVGRYASYDPLQNPKKWCQFNNFVEKQLLEISQNYGELDILWLDGGWVNSEHHEFLDMDKIVDKIRHFQKQMLVVDRTIGGPYEEYVTPERTIPNVAPKKAWESNIPLAKNWGYVPNDIYKPFPEILQNIMKVVALGGNIILGVGPKPDGTLPEEALAIMKQLGAWLRDFGEGVYGSQPVPQIISKGWYITQKDRILYVYALREKFRDQEFQNEKIRPHIVSRHAMSTMLPDAPILGEKIVLDTSIKSIFN